MVSNVQVEFEGRAGGGEVFNHVSKQRRRNHTQKMTGLRKGVHQRAQPLPQPILMDQTVQAKAGTPGELPKAV